MGKPAPEIATEALDQPYLRRVLGSVARARFGSAREVTALTAERSRRAVLRYAAWLSEPGSSENAPWRVIGKVYETPEAGLRAFDVMRTLWDHGFSRRAPAAVRIPEPYVYIPELRLLFMEEAPGSRLKSLVRKRLAGPEHMRLLAAAMVKLHRSPPIFDQPFTVDHHLAIRCAGLPDALAEAYPDLADAIQRIVNAAREAERHLGPGAFTLVHGDFHLGQFQIQDESIWILDLDPLNLGDPAYDLAMVFVALKQLEQRTGGHSYTYMLRDAFLSAYFSEMDWEIASRVPLHEAMIHLKRACNRLRWKNEPGWQERIPAQIRQGVACLDAWHTLEAPRSVGDLTQLYVRCPGAL